MLPPIDDIVLDYGVKKLTFNSGASMSGDLRKPSKSIPKGTLHSLLFTFLTYALVIFFMGASVSRITLHKDLDVIQDVASPLKLKQYVY